MCCGGGGGERVCVWRELIFLKTVILINGNKTLCVTQQNEELSDNAVMEKKEKNLDGKDNPVGLF